MNGADTKAERAQPLREALLAEAQRLAHLGSWTWDIATDQVIWSDEMYRVYGYEPGAIDLSLETFLAHAHPDDRPMVDRIVRRALEDSQPVDFFHRIVRADGQVRVLHGKRTTVNGPDGRPVRMWGTAQDITERREAEQALVEMYQRLADSGEAERLHLARELHDGPLQDLYAVRLHLGDLPGDEGARAQAEMQQIIDRLRQICHDVRPPALMPFGLEVAIRSHAERFRAAHPEIHVDLDLERDGQRVPEKTRLALYRIYQHAVANIAQHAEAQHARVSLSLAQDQVTLTVRDDGQGFEVPAQWLALARRGHLGLLGASERAVGVGGRLEVASAPGDGTLVRVTAPIAATNGLEPVPKEARATPRIWP